MSTETHSAFPILYLGQLSLLHRNRYSIIVHNDGTLSHFGHPIPVTVPTYIIVGHPNAPRAIFGIVKWPRDILYFFVEARKVAINPICICASFCSSSAVMWMIGGKRVFLGIVCRIAFTSTPVEENIPRNLLVRILRLSTITFYVCNGVFFAIINPVGFF